MAALNQGCAEFSQFYACGYSKHILSKKIIVIATHCFLHPLIQKLQNFAITRSQIILQFCYLKPMVQISLRIEINYKCAIYIVRQLYKLFKYLVLQWSNPKLYSLSVLGVRRSGNHQMIITNLYRLHELAPCTNVSSAAKSLYNCYKNWQMSRVGTSISVKSPPRV